MKNNNLKQLLLPWITKTYTSQLKITGIESDSRLIKSGNLFFSLHNNVNKRHQHITEAIKKGALMILCNTQKKNKNDTLQKFVNKIPIVHVFKLSKIFPLILKKYYCFKNKFILIGITGTNGKSTIAHIIAQWTSFLNIKIGVMGTLGHGIYKKLKLGTNTTESSIKIYKFLYNMSKENIKTVVMEVSSHGIVQHRTLGLPFKIAIFTNITPEHLDYHKTMKEYIRAKYSFLFKYNINTLIINANDPIAITWIKKLAHKNLITITTNRNINFPLSKKWINTNKITYENNFTNIHFNSSWGNGILKSKLIGHFNVINILLAFATLLELKYPIVNLIKVCNYIQTICGRMQYFNVIQKPKIIIDYAHNADALKNLLTTLRTQFENKKIWCIFGCGGNRDKIKRAHMGSIAEEISDTVILTNDNPRNESPLKIIQDILTGCKNKNKINIILNRENAIKFAIQNAHVQDIIVIAGKGHEIHQTINNKNYYFSDQNIVQKLLQ